MKYNVVIIGAGPAGMAAAHSLINNNISCCVIDKQVFPRNKLCAGGITGKAMDLINTLQLGEEYKGKSTIISTGASLYVGYNHIADIRSEKATYLVDRFEFDEYLVNSFKSKGGNIIEGVKVNYISNENKKLMLSNNEIIEYEYIIGADGVFGRTRSMVDTSLKNDGFCLQVDVAKSELKYDGDNMSLYYGIVPYGYGWIFPKENYITVGMGANYTKDIDFKNEFGKFLENIGVQRDIKDFKGGFVPFGKYISYPLNKKLGIILVGDAAGFADPITGEGIYFGVLSGIKAAKVIEEAIVNTDDNRIEEYINEIEPITSNIHKAQKIKNYLYRYRKVAFTPFKNERIGSVLFNKHIYNSDYNFKISNFFER